MLMRILADNPGRTFTRNLADPKFAGAVKELLRHGKDPSVRQILSESLENFEITKGDDEGLRALRDVWVKEKTNMSVLGAKNRRSIPLILGGNSGGEGHQQYQGRPHHRQHHARQHYSQAGGLPDMEELAARIAEAQTSAKLLEQVLQSTPQAEVPSNDLIKVYFSRDPAPKPILTACPGIRRPL
jgi:hypothetical protein